MELADIIDLEGKEIVAMLAKSKGTVIHCENYKSIVKAVEMKKAEMKGVASSVAAQEREAYASKEYRDLIDEWEKSTHDCVILEYALKEKHS